MHGKVLSTQRVVAISGGGLAHLDLPGPGERVGARGPRWGRAEVLLTPAYWAAQSWMWEADEPDHYRLGRSLAEELLACILGGHGIPAEVGLAAYQRVRTAYEERGTALADAGLVEELLATPLELGGRRVRYRFARQRARYVAAAVAELPDIDEGLADRPLRDRITRIVGFGPKTASWAVRNWRGSDDVAILDIHILRAGVMLGIFEPQWRVERHYHRMEDAYLGFASDIGVKASVLDSVMWMTMRQVPALAPRRPHASRGDAAVALAS